jgi:hypothetical protein
VTEITIDRWSTRKNLSVSPSDFDLAPVRALGSAGAIAQFPALAAVKALTVLAEVDDDGANERTTTECAGR